MECGRQLRSGCAIDREEWNRLILNCLCSMWKKVGLVVLGAISVNTASDLRDRAVRAGLSGDGPPRFYIAVSKPFGILRNYLTASSSGSEGQEADLCGFNPPLIPQVLPTKTPLFSTGFYQSGAMGIVAFCVYSSYYSAP